MKKYRFLFLFFLLGFLFSGCFLSGNSHPQKEKREKEASARDDFDILITSEDSVFFKEFVSSNDIGNLKHRELSEIIIQVALYFDGSPYLANTLDVSDEEKLVVNLRGFDCTTFVENVLAFSFLVKQDDVSLSSFINNLKSRRYRDEIMSGYPSRLHYFSDWLYNNSQKGIVDIVSNDFGNRDFVKDVDYMTKNFSKYSGLSRNPAFVTEMSVVEKRISKYDFKYVTGDYISEIADLVSDGDIIAFSTNIEGLDVVHVGIAYFSNDILHFIHASTNGNRVRISEAALAEYVIGRRYIDGVLIARPKEDFLLN